MLAARVAPAACAAVVKADGYGLGAARVAAALSAAGCRCFFVAHLAEAVALRDVLGPEPVVQVLNGLPPGTEPVFVHRGLWPVLNSLDQVERWHHHARAAGRPLPASLQLDTGMSRFGLPSPDLDRLAAHPAMLEGIDLRLVMSHLGCADDPADERNEQQRLLFERLRATLPAVPASLAASSGIFLGRRFHLDLVRPGAALYGVPPQNGSPNPMRPVVRLEGRVVQLRAVPAGAWVGYGARFEAVAPMRIATVAVGYADGFLRAGGGRGIATLPEGGPALPIIGRISMDSLGVDVSALPPERLREGDTLDLIGPHRPLADAAAAAGTIGYEMLTSLGQRYHRRYEGG
ncbi:alanine racemase [Acetobacteraceae bacterium KSS12]|uniref:Alanine racemase n=2 Tax=Rhizosaccharibacter radicis TaxID=2782605 RepID=A0ABT1W084_9PROT|nr:alanine racemase [Acetobacteraceae bacterium KSS12]